MLACILHAQHDEQPVLGVQVRYVIGECFYHAAPDEAEERVTAGVACRCSSSHACALDGAQADR